MVPVIALLIGVVMGVILERAIRLAEAEAGARRRRENMKYAERVIREARETATTAQEAADGQRFAGDILDSAERGATSRKGPPHSDRPNPGR